MLQVFDSNSANLENLFRMMYIDLIFDVENIFFNPPNDSTFILVIFKFFNLLK